MAMGGDGPRLVASPATSISRETPAAEARADAEPPPGVGSGALNAESRSRSVRSMSFMTPPRQQRVPVSSSAPLDDDLSFLDDRPDRLRPDADQIDRRSVDDDGVHLLAGLEAADPIVAVDRVGRVDR